MSNRAKNRPKRTPLHRRRLLEAKPRAGFVRRWVNEDIGAVGAYKEAGWTPVEGDEDASEKRAQTEGKMGSVVRRVVNKDPQASAKTAILMEIPEELYLEDQAEKSRLIDEREAGYNPDKYKQHGSDYGSMKKSYK